MFIYANSPDEKSTSAQISAGAYRTNITPAIGCSLQGSFDDVRATEILDDLYANALVLSDGISQMALISVDLCEVDNATYRSIVAEIEKTLGIPQDHVLLAATHTHHGPYIGNSIVANAEVTSYYVEHFKKQVLSAAAMAQKRMQPVSVSAGKADNPDYVFNRRLRKPEGGIVMNWIDPIYLQNTQPSGPVDPQLIAIRFDDERGQPVAYIINYANHNNAVTGTGISADISGYMGDLLRKIYGPELIVIFLLGACGNVNWLDWRNPDHWNKDHYKDIATGLTGTVLEITARMEPCPADQLKIAHRTLNISERPYNDIDTHVDDTFGDEADVFFEVYKAARAEAEGKPLPVHQVGLYVLRIGLQIAIVTSPNELFCDFGLAIKAGSPFKYTLVSELTNGAMGYIPTQQAFQEGGYEIRKLPGNSFLALDAGEQTVAASLELLKQLSESG